MIYPPRPPAGLARTFLSPSHNARPDRTEPGRSATGNATSLQLLTTQLSQREIADELHLSLNTVKTHNRQIFRKLAVSTRAQADTAAREHGLL